MKDITPGKIAWTGFLLLSIALGLPDAIEKYQGIMAPFSFWMLMQSIIAIVVVATIAKFLMDTHKFFGWSIFSLIPNTSYEWEENGKKVTGININLIPFKIPLVSVIFGALLFIYLPTAALWEEELFRAGTNSWQEGLLRSFLFGVAHCLVGVPIGAGLAITVSGVWFTWCYFVGGVELSAASHATYNSILVFLLIIFSVRNSVDELKRVLK